MIIWRRWGVLAPILAFVTLIATQVALDAVKGEGYYSASSWGQGLAILLGGLVVGAIGFLLNSRAREAQESTHTLFFIPMEIWGGVLAIVGIVSFFQG